MLDFADHYQVWLNVPLILSGPGEFGLQYAVLARDFPIHSFTVDLTVTGDISTTTAEIRGVQGSRVTLG